MHQEKFFALYFINILKYSARSRAAQLRARGVRTPVRPSGAPETKALGLQVRRERPERPRTLRTVDLCALKQLE